jgi:hypothetical protein
VFSIALLGTVFGAPSIFLYIPASKRSMSCLFHKPAAASGVPMYMSIALARQHVRRSSTSQSARLSLHLSSCTFLVIYSFEILIWSFLLIVTFTPKYLTVVVQIMPLMPLSSSNYSPVSISDFLLLSLRFHFTCSAVNSSMIYTISCWLFDITSMSSANASKSPLDRTSFNFYDDLIASSRYTLNSTGESTEPYGNPISALISCSPTWMIDSLWSLVSSVTIALSLSSLHLFSRNTHRISLSTE